MLVLVMIHEQKGTTSPPQGGTKGRKMRLRIAYIAPSELFMLVNSFRGAAEPKVQLVPPMGHSTFLIYIIPDN